MYTPLINGTAYSWSQIKLNALGVNVVGIDAIKYGEKQEVEDNKGGGNRPVSRGYGSIEATSSITLHMEEVEAMQAASPTGSLLGIPEFDIIVSFVPTGGRIVTHVLHNVKFVDNMRDIKQGDMKIPVECELRISHISWK